MGRTTIDGMIIGETGTRRFSFLVDTGPTYVGLPLPDIEALGLPKVPGGSLQVQTASGVVTGDSYAGMVRIEDERAPTIVMVSPVPLIGYEVLENLRYRVNPVSQRLEKSPTTRSRRRSCCLVCERQSAPIAAGIQSAISATTIPLCHQAPDPAVRGRCTIFAGIHIPSNPSPRHQAAASPK